MNEPVMDQEEIIDTKRQREDTDHQGQLPTAGSPRWTDIYCAEQANCRRGYPDPVADIGQEAEKARCFRLLRWVPQYLDKIKACRFHDKHGNDVEQSRWNAGKDNAAEYIFPGEDGFNQVYKIHRTS